MHLCLRDFYMAQRQGVDFMSTQVKAAATRRATAEMKRACLLVHVNGEKVKWRTNTKLRRVRRPAGMGHSNMRNALLRSHPSNQTFSVMLVIHSSSTINSTTIPFSLKRHILKSSPKKCFKHLYLK